MTTQSPLFITDKIVQQSNYNDCGVLLAKKSVSSCYSSSSDSQYIIVKLFTSLLQEHASM